MKITIDVDGGDYSRHHAEYTFDWIPTEEVIKQLADICELHKLKEQARKIKEHKRADLHRKEALEQAPNEFPPERNDGPHNRVWEYDGAFKCLDCHELWGHLPGNPVMPEKCSPVKKAAK